MFPFPRTETRAELDTDVALEGGRELAREGGRDMVTRLSLAHCYIITSLHHSENPDFSTLSGNQDSIKSLKYHF